MQGGGLESLIKAISGLGQVGPKPEFAHGANADTWPKVRRALLDSGLLEAIDTGVTDAPMLQFHPDLSRWLNANRDTESRLETTRNHQRHYFQFAGQLRQRRHRDPQASALLTRLERANLHHAVDGALAQGEEWALEFVDRIGELFSEIGEPWDDLHSRAETLARHLGGDPWRLRLSNQAQHLFESREFRAAEQILHELLAGLETDAHFERASAWARIAHCRLQAARPNEARAALMTAAGLCAELERSEAVLEMLRRISLDLVAVCDELEAGHWWQHAIDCHVGLARTRARLAEYADFLTRIEAACCTPEHADALHAELDQARAAGWTAGADAIAAVVAGERDLFRLSVNLDLDDAALIATLLKRLRASS